MKTFAFFAFPLMLAPAAHAEDAARQMDAHVHGESAFQIAVEGNRVEVVLRAPGADIVGFEHEAESDADKALIEAALETLSDPANVLTMPQSAGCQIKEAEVDLHGGDNRDHDKHDHDAEAEGGHTEFHAQYTFDCTDPAALTRIDLPFFESFENAMEVHAEYVLGTGAGAGEATRDDPTLPLN